MFRPRQVYIEEQALDYPMGARLLREFRKLKGGPRVEVYRWRLTGLPTEPRRRFRLSKETLVIKVRDNLEFQTCKPSAHYQLPLASSCPAMCEYCYLHNTQARAAYVRLYANVEDILERAREYIRERDSDITRFEGAATSDPVPVEPYSGSLARAVEMMGQEENGRFRFVTKFGGVEFLEGLDHRGHTQIRFSVNAPEIIRKYEHRTDSLEERLEGALAASRWGYPVGFMIAPIFLDEGFEELYGPFISYLAARIEDIPSPRFELVTHRFTSRARSRILELFPRSDLPLDESERVRRRGQFGYMKMVYPKINLEEARQFFVERLQESIPGAEVDYFI